MERNLTGGTCHNFGCTPSKALIRAARAVHGARDGTRFGCRLGSAPQIALPAVMERVRELCAAANAEDGVSALAKAGADMWLGEAGFVDPEIVEVEGRRLRFGPGGIETDHHLRTANPNVYAAGDVALPEKFTHAAVVSGILAARNALSDGAPRSVHDLVVPRCTYTDPEVAQVACTLADAGRRGMVIETHRLAMAGVEQAHIDGETEGFVDLYTHGDAVVGATLVSSHVGETISLVTAAVMQRMRPATLAAFIHCYPTQALTVQMVADRSAKAGLP